MNPVNNRRMSLPDGSARRHPRTEHAPEEYPSRKGQLQRSADPVAAH